MMNQVGGKVIFFPLPSEVIFAISTSPFAWDASIGDYGSEMDCQDQFKTKLVSCKAAKEPGIEML
jgi:hypothetical protein